MKPLDTRNKQRIFVVFERLSQEEKTPETPKRMDEPPALNMGLAHV